jgi:hypothetical protein
MIYLVSGIPTTLKNMISSVGMMEFPIYMGKTCSTNQPWIFNKISTYILMINTVKYSYFAMEITR